MKFIKVFFILASFLYGGNTITNMATSSFSIGGVQKNVNSNAVTNEVKETVGELNIFKADEKSSISQKINTTRYLDNNGNWQTVSIPILDNGNVLDISQPVALNETSIYATSDLSLIQVKDVDRNLDSTQIDIITVNVISPNLDKETLELKETGPNTGIFTGYINMKETASSNFDGVLTIVSEGLIEVEYLDQSGKLTKNAKIAPNSYVFIAETGAILSGIEVSLIDVISNKTIITRTTDNNGKYNFGFVPDGTYKVSIFDSSKKYYFPSAYSPDELSQFNFVVKDNISYGKNFSLKGGSLKADIPLDSERPNIWVEKEVNKASVSIGDIVQYTLIVHNDGSGKASDLNLIDHLPQGVKYKNGTSKLDDKKIKPTISKDGKDLTFLIPVLEGESEAKVKFVAEITPGIINGEAVNTTWVKDVRHSTTSNIASVKIKVEEELMRSEGIIVGQVYDCKWKDTREFNGVEGVRIYLEDGTYILTDKDGKYHFEGVHAGTHVVQIDEALLPSGWDVGTITNNTRNAGRKFSQFVNMGKGALKRVDFCLDRSNTIREADDYNYTIPEVKKAPKIKEKDLYAVQGKTDIIWPTENYIPDAPSTKIAIAHSKGTTYKLYLNGKEVSKLNFRERKEDNELDTVIEVYKGVDLLKGVNIIRADIYKNGEIIKSIKRKVNVTGQAVRIEYIADKSYNIADGQHNPVIAVRFIDAMGNPLRVGMTGDFKVDDPYLAKKNSDELKENPLGLEKRDTKYIIANDGIAYIELEPTTQSGVATIHFDIQKRDIVVRPYLKPKLRDWIMVGFAEGTVGYNKLSGNKEGLSAKDSKETLTEGRVSFFAKGKVKGDVLLTLSYDSGKDTKNSKLFDQIDPNKYYTLYNDGTNQNYEAPSRKKLFVKLEKDEYSAMYGDFNTNMSETQLARYSRSMTGIKTEYHGDKLEGEAFISNTDQLFEKEEIRGDGTSGKYHLKNTDIVEFSEKITIEVRDRYRPEIIIKSTSLQRYRDYTIDYTDGTIYFKEPIYSTDDNFNPRFIVVDYEREGDGTNHYTYGARGTAKITNDIKVGATYISQDTSKQKSEMYAADVVANITNSIIAKAEYAKTKTTEDGNTTYGEAKLVEFDYINDNYYGRVYFREQDTSFGLGQLNSNLGGTRKFGAELKKIFDNRVFIEGLVYRDMDLGEETQQDIGEFKVGINKEDWTVFTGYRYSKNDSTGKNSQILIGGKYSMLDNRLVLVASHDQSLDEEEGAKDKLYPTKTMVGFDYKITSKASIFGKQEWMKDNDIDRRGKVGLRLTPWEGLTLERATVSEYSNDLSKVYDTIGLLQTYNINDNWSVNLGYENSVLGDEDLFKDDNTTIDPFQAYRIGVNYHNDEWTGLVNYERRTSDEEKKHNLLASLYSQVNDDLALAFSSGFFIINNSVLGDKKESNARFSLAYRPANTEWIILDKLDFIYNVSDVLDSEENTAKVINNMNLNYLPENSLFELSLQSGIKYVEESIEDYDHKGTTALFGLDTRYDFTEKITGGIQASVLYSFSADNYDYCYGAYFDYLLFTNMLVELGYNIEGFEDKDFSLQNYREAGPFVKFKMKFDQHSLKDMVRASTW